MMGDTGDGTQGASSDETGGWDRPSRRTVLGGIGGVAASSLAVSQVGAQFGSSGPATPTVEGPIEGGSQTGRPLTAAPHDFESAGYVEEEYFISGEAEPIEGGLLGSLSGGDDSSGDGPAEYKTRILVYRPEDPADFNGGVLAEWFNVSLQTDFPVAWPNAYDYLQRNGWAVALVSAQKVGVDDSAEDRDLVTWDPERYGDLHHPGDTYALDIFAQAIAALRRGDSDGSGTGITDGSGGWFGSGSSGGTSTTGGSGGWFGSGGSGSSGSSGGSSGGWLGASLGGTTSSGHKSDGLWGDGGDSGSSSGSGSDSSGGWWGSDGSGGSDGSSGGTGGTGDDPHPLGGLDAEYVVATGQSQSSGYINSFINEVEPDYDIVDGFLPAAGSPLNLSTDVKPTIWLNTMSEAAGGSLTNPGEGDGSSGDGLFSNVTSGENPLEDVDIDPSVLAELSDQEPPEDEGQFRFWEVAGAVHVNQWLSFWAGAARRRDFGTDDPPWDPDVAANYGEQEDGQYGVCEYNYFPHRYTFPAALDALRGWIQDGEPAPSAPRMERTDDGLAKDEHGNAVGGIRLPPIEAPVATYEDSCDLPTGKTIRFDEATLDELYPTNDEYVAQFEAAAQSAVEDGFLLQEGADELVARAEASPIGQ